MRRARWWLSVTTESPTTALHTCLGLHQEDVCQALESTRTVSTLLRVRLGAMIPHTLQLPVCCRSSLPIPRARRRSCCASLLRTWRLATGMRMPRTRRFSTANKWSPRSHRSTMWCPLPRSSAHDASFHARERGDRPRKLTRADVAAEAVSWGLATTDVESVVDRVLKDLEKGIRIASTAYPAAAARHEANALERIRKLKGVPGIEMALIWEQGRRCSGCNFARRKPLSEHTSAPVRVDGCHATSGRFCRKWALILPWVLGFCAIFRRRRPLSTSADLGKRCRCAAFRVESACKTAQKSQAGFPWRCKLP